MAEEAGKWDAEELLHRADAAMYTAKREGRAGPALVPAQRMPSQAARTTRPA